VAEYPENKCVNALLFGDNWFCQIEEILAAPASAVLPASLPLKCIKLLSCLQQPQERGNAS
jgi:hypothetical protein